MIYGGEPRCFGNFCSGRPDRGESPYRGERPPRDERPVQPVEPALTPEQQQAVDR